MTELELQRIERLFKDMAAGDQQACAQLYNRIEGKLFGICCAILKGFDRSEAEDALVGGWMKVWTNAIKWNKRNETDRAFHWIAVVVSNTARDRRRQLVREAARQNKSVDPHENPDILVTPDDQTDATERSLHYDRLDQCMKQLEPVRERAIRLRYLGYTHEQLMAELKLTKNQVRYAIAQASKALEKCLSHA